MRQRALTLIEVITALIIVALASGIALFSIPKARARYSDSRLKAAAQVLLHRAVQISTILNNECTLSIDTEENHKLIKMKVSGLVSGATRHHFETNLALPETVNDVYFEEDNKRTESLSILPTYSSERSDLSLIIENGSSNRITVSLPTIEPRLSPLLLPDEIYQARSLKGV